MKKAPQGAFFVPEFRVLPAIIFLPIIPDCNFRNVSSLDLAHRFYLLGLLFQLVTLS